MSELTSLPSGKFNTVLADPPWGYEGKTAPWRSTSTQSYSLMTHADIASLPVNSITTEDAHLYLWAVLPLMDVAFATVRAWGFAPDTMLTWCKPGVGLGGGYRGNTEHLIVGRKGDSSLNPTCAICGGRKRGARKCFCSDPAWRFKGEPIEHYAEKSPFLDTAEGTWYAAPRSAHSEKPALFADLIERMSPRPYIELFARQPRMGWESWGLGYEVAHV